MNSVGGRIPEECVPIGRCLTLNPIWMNGAHPTGTDDISICVKTLSNAIYSFKDE